VGELVALLLLSLLAPTHSTPPPSFPPFHPPHIGKLKMPYTLKALVAPLTEEEQEEIRRLLRQGENADVVVSRVPPVCGWMTR